MIVMDWSKNMNTSSFSLILVTKNALSSSTFSRFQPFTGARIRHLIINHVFMAGEEQPIYSILSWILLSATSLAFVFTNFPSSNFSWMNIWEHTALLFCQSVCSSPLDRNLDSWDSTHKPRHISSCQLYFWLTFLIEHMALHWWAQSHHIRNLVAPLATLARLHPCQRFPQIHCHYDYNCLP